MPQKPRTVRMDDITWDKAADLAHAAGRDVSISEMIRRWIDAEWKKHERRQSAA